MGYLTVVVIHNDALGAFEKDPKAFGEAVLKGIGQASLYSQEASVPFKEYTNYISVHPPRHADHHTVYVNYGNTVLELGSKDHKEFKELRPQIAKNFVDAAKRVINNL